MYQILPHKIYYHKIKIEISIEKNIQFIVLTCYLVSIVSKHFTRRVCKVPSSTNSSFRKDIEASKLLDQDGNERGKCHNFHICS